MRPGRTRPAAVVAVLRAALGIARARCALLALPRADRRDPLRERHLELAVGRAL